MIDEDEIKRRRQKLIDNMDEQIKTATEKAPLPDFDSEDLEDLADLHEEVLNQFAEAVKTQSGGTRPTGAAAVNQFRERMKRDFLTDEDLGDD